MDFFPQALLSPRFPPPAPRRQVAAVKTGHAPYANLRRDAPYVAEIKVTPVKAE